MALKPRDPLFWWEHAACDRAPDALQLAFGDQEQMTCFAATYCARCPVLKACLDHAEHHNEQHGVWGGLTPNQREARHRWRRQLLRIRASA
jgi:WhiB family transcriptional regulator, redox-sensing transcriptional regulator